jgi:hypothetical protein
VDGLAFIVTSLDLIRKAEEILALHKHIVE